MSDKGSNDGGDAREPDRDNDREEEDRGRSSGGGDRRRGGSPGRGSGRQMTSSLLVRNLSFQVRADELKRLFGKYGEIRDVYLPTVSCFSLLFF
jgi:RNA recognition motif-containing protein